MRLLDLGMGVSGVQESMDSRQVLTHSAKISFDVNHMGSDLVGQYASRQLLREPYPYLNNVLAMGVRLLDVICVVAGSFIAFWVEKNWGLEQPHVGMLAPNVIAVLVFFLFPKKSKLLAFPKIRRFKAQFRYLVTPLLTAGLVFFLLCVLLSFTRDEVIRCTAEWLIISGFMLGLGRLGLSLLLYQPAIVKLLKRRVAIIGTGETAVELISKMSGDAGQTYALFGVFQDQPENGGLVKAGGNLQDLLRRSRREALHAIILAFQNENDSDARVREVALALRPVLSDIYVTPNLVSGFDRVLPCEYLGENPVFVVQRRPLSEVQSLEKGIVDLLLAALISFFILPFLLFVVVAIKLDSKGPIFFRQPRIGKNGKEFLVYKFRSMHTHMSDLMAATQTSRNDPRVTRVGRWLRKLSIDEIPQLLNVLKGEMSLVGPRPHAPHTRAGGLLLDDALAEYVLRYHVKPGITGWAQINGARGELVTIDDLKKRVTYDLEYIRRWSLLFDFKIMFLTVIREVFSRHAF